MDSLWKQKKEFKWKKSDSLCWRCGRAFGGCNWSDNFEPVDGWDADERIYECENMDGDVSYFVRACPMFVEDKPKYTGDTARWMRLVNAIVKRAVNDYTLARKNIEKGKIHLDSGGYTKTVSEIIEDVEGFFRSKWFAVITDLDGEKCIEALKNRSNKKEIQ